MVGSASVSCRGSPCSTSASESISLASPCPAAEQAVVARFVGAHLRLSPLVCVLMLTPTMCNAVQSRSITLLRHLRAKPSAPLTLVGRNWVTRHRPACSVKFGDTKNLERCVVPRSCADGDVRKHQGHSRAVKRGRLADQVLPRQLVATFFQYRRECIHVHIGDQHRIVVGIGGRRVLLQEDLVRLHFLVICP